ncbi:alpha/beta fold hydrolase [Streptomyces mirabilis]|uniref:alpha/beta fold hydrolase n=1 Tax=Streptomyces mirabilis TaxID=68239 RepID=UPI0036CD564D
MMPTHPSHRAERVAPVLLQQRTTADAGEAGPRVLLLHGMADSSAVWDRLCALAPHHDALRRARLHSAALPWRGTGPSDWAHRPEPTTWISDTLDQMAATAGPADVVVAHSFSAMLLLDLLCGRSAPAGHRIGGIVLVSPFFRPRPEDFDWDTLKGLPEQFVRTMEEGIRVAAGSRAKPELHRAMAERLCETIGPYGWSRFLETYLRTPWLRTAELRTTTLVVSGADDRIAVPAEAETLVARTPSAALHTIEGTGHFPMSERPAQFAAVLDGFLRRITAHPETARMRPLSTLVERT